MNKAKVINEKSKVVVARASFVRQSPRKLRKVMNAVKDMDLTTAVASLKNAPQKSAKMLWAVYQQGLANAKNNFNLSPGDLTVKSVVIEEGPRGPKKADVHAHGARYDRGVRRKRLAHIKLELISKEATWDKK